MFNIYNADRMIKMDETRLESERKLVQWAEWKDKKSKYWLNNFHNRIRKFLDNVIILIIQVGESNEDYKKVFDRSRANPEFSDNQNSISKCVGPPYFIFRPAKTEKERIKESIEHNKYLLSEPLKKSVYEYAFRDRERSKEIQSDMKFTSRRNIELPVNKTSVITTKTNETKDSKKKGFGSEFRFKSAFGLMFTPSPCHIKSITSLDILAQKPAKSKQISSNNSKRGTIVKCGEEALKSRVEVGEYSLGKVAESVLTKCNYIPNKPERYQSYAKSF